MMGCVEVEELAAELALGLVGGPERAQALAHIVGCARCRALVDELSATADELVLLAPSAEPSSGFEARVLAQLQPTAPVPIRRIRRRVVAAVAAVSVAAAVVLGVAFAVRPAADHDVIEATMRTASGRDVGDAYLHNGDPAWVFVAVPGWTDGTQGPQPIAYQVRVTLEDGSSRVLPGGDLAGGDGAWGTVLQVDPALVTNIALVDGDGTVWCSAAI
ncbi:MAG: hypothetical protein QOE63_1688 [Acidimicrobiaceae bacterium]